MDTDRKGQFDPLNTRNYAKGGEFDSDPGFAVRVKAGSGASTSPFSRCLAGQVLKEIWYFFSGC